MDPETAQLFINKPVDLRFIDGFALRGTITSIDPYGLVFVTPQRTSYIAFSKIDSIIVED